MCVWGGERMDEFSLLSQAYEVGIIIPIIKMRRLSLKEILNLSHINEW